METTEQAIKRIVTGVLPGAEVILFGARARKDHREDSDWDLLVVTEEEIEGSDCLSLSAKIGNKLDPILAYGCDILVRSKQYVEKRKTWPGHILRWATEEGLRL